MNVNFQPQSLLPIATTGPKRILSVDDEPAILFTRHKLLEGAGYEVISAADGEQALDIFAAYFACIDLVLLDYALPGMDGGVVALEIKRCKREVPVIIVSASSVPNNVLIRVDCLIRKRDGPALLLEKIGHLLAPRSAPRSVEQERTTTDAGALRRKAARSSGAEAGP